MFKDKQGRLVEKIADDKTGHAEATQTSKADEIVKMFKDQVFAKNSKGSTGDQAHRATKIIGSIGEQNMSTSQIKELMQAGMDVARLNMDYFEPNMMSKLISNVHAASDELANSCPIFIDLKGMLVRTMMETKPIQLQPGQNICISDDTSMAGKFEDLFVIDSPKFAAKLRQGDKITLNYGTVELIVKDFISKDEYMSRINASKEEEKTA